MEAGVQTCFAAGVPAMPVSSVNLKIRSSVLKPLLLGCDTELSVSLHTVCWCSRVKQINRSTWGVQCVTLALCSFHRWEKDGQVSRELWEKAGQQGLLGVAIAEKHGGIGADILSSAIVWEEQ